LSADKVNEITHKDFLTSIIDPKNAANPKRVCTTRGSIAKIIRFLVYIQEFWNDPYLEPTARIVLNLNPCFLLEDDPDANIAKRS